MALILNKDIIGSIEYDEYGNTIETGFTNLYYIDEYGVKHTDPYLVIDTISINKKNKNINIGVKIYSSENSRLNDLKPILDTMIHVSDKYIYENYFEINKISNDNIFKYCYLYVQEYYFENWKSDED